MRKVGMLLAIGLLIALVPAVLAGGWAVITLDDMPGEIHAGEPWTVGFTVLQHGQTPVHKLDDSYGGVMVEPTLIATNPDTGQRVMATATPTEEIGHFTVEVTFPSEGAWEWTIEPAPLSGETQFEPLNVLPAVAAAKSSSALVEPVIAPAASQQAAESTSQVAAPAAETTTSSALLRWAALAVALLALALFVVQSWRRAQTAAVESQA